MILKIGKRGEVIQYWGTVEEAAKAIKVSPKILKGHLKGQPPKLGGYKFEEKTNFSADECVTPETTEKPVLNELAELDEFGEPLGHPAIPPEVIHEEIPPVKKAIRVQSEEPAGIHPDWLLTPMERRLKRIRERKQS